MRLWTSLLPGWKTYIIGAGAIIYGIYGWANGTLDQESALASVWAGLTAWGLRASR